MTGTILVTGGAGFVGSHVVDLLVEAGHEVRVLDSLHPAAHADRPDYLNPAAEYVHGSVEDRAAVDRCLQGVSAVSHQAAMVGLGVEFEDVEGYVRNNDLGTAVLLRALAAARFRGRLVLASSMVVYGEGRYRCGQDGLVLPGPRDPGQLARGLFEPVCPRCGRFLVPAPLTEDAPLRPANVYAATKLQQEHLCAVFGRETGATVTRLRYHNVYGPRMPRDTPYSGVAALFRSALDRGEAPKVLEDGRQLRDFVHVRDVARANVLALSGERPAAAFNVASGEPRTIAEMASALASAFGPSAPRPEVTGGFRLGDVRHCFAASDNAAAVLGFTATVPFAEGMRAFASEPLRAAGDASPRPGRPRGLSTPIFRSTAFEVAPGARPGTCYAYSRLRNPTVDAVADRVGALDGAEDALLVASGTAAMAAVVAAFVPLDGKVVAARELCADTQALLADRQRRLVRIEDDEGWRDALVAGADLVIVEAISNPELRVADLPDLARLAHEAGARLVVDATVATPLNVRPLDHRADLVVHSATKYLSGHSDVTAGSVAGGRAAVAEVRRAADRLGAALDPHAASLLERGLKTLALRLERQNASALELAAFLEAQSQVESVFYPLLESHPDYERARRLLRGGGGVVSFRILGGADRAARLVRELRLIRSAPTLGGVESLVALPFEHGAGLLRLSIGIEDPAALAADLEQALSATAARTAVAAELRSQVEDASGDPPQRNRVAVAPTFMPVAAAPCFRSSSRDRRTDLARPSAKQR